MSVLGCDFYRSMQHLDSTDRRLAGFGQTRSFNALFLCRDFQSLSGIGANVHSVVFEVQIQSATVHCASDVRTRIGVNTVDSYIATSAQLKTNVEHGASLDCFRATRGNCCRSILYEQRFDMNGVVTIIMKVDLDVNRAARQENTR